MNKDIEDCIKIFISFITALFTVIIPMLFVKYRNTLGNAEIVLNVLFVLDTYFVYDLVKHWVNGKFKQIKNNIREDVKNSLKDR